MRSLLNSYSSTTIILMFVGGTVALALVGVLVANKFFPNLADGPFEDTVDGLRVVYELVFALILAFVIGSVLDSFSTAEASVAAEASTLSHMKRANDGLPFDQQRRLDSGINQYVHAIVETEWDTMRTGDGEGSPRASAALESLYALYQSYSPPPADGVEAEFYSKAVDQLSEVTSARRERLSLSSSDLPALLRVILPLGVLLLLVFEYRSRMPLRPRFIHMGLLATVVSFCYLLTIVMNYPFSGDVSVSSNHFKAGALATFWARDEPHVLADDEIKLDLTPSKLAGVWNSDTYGVVVIREVGDELRAVYRLGTGTVVGRISPDGVFRGWWCHTSTRQPPDDAGDVEWTLASTPTGEVVFGSWRFGTEEPFRGDWDLVMVGGFEPLDLAPRFDDETQFCRHP